MKSVCAEAEQSPDGTVDHDLIPSCEKARRKTASTH